MSSTATASSTSSSARSSARTSWTSPPNSTRRSAHSSARRGFGLERHRLADRQDQDHRPVRAAPGAVRPRARPLRLLRDAPPPDLQLLHPRRRLPRRRPRRGGPTDEGRRPRSPRNEGIALYPGKRKGDLRRHRRAGLRRPPGGRYPVPLQRVRPGQFPRGRPADRRGLGPPPSQDAATSTSRITTRRRTGTSPPARAAGRSPS